MTTITPETITEAWRLRKEGMSWERLADKLGYGIDALRRRMDPAWAEKKRAVKRMGARENLPFVHNTRQPDKPTAAEISAALKRIPEDTRDLTARLMGDPLPGRRAIDMRVSA